MIDINIIRPSIKSRLTCVEIWAHDELVDRSWFKTKKLALAFVARTRPGIPVKCWVEA